MSAMGGGGEKTEAVGRVFFYIACFAVETEPVFISRTYGGKARWMAEKGTACYYTRLEKSC